MVVRYRKPPDRDYVVIALRKELVERYPERGFGKLFKLIRFRGPALEPQAYLARVLRPAGGAAAQGQAPTAAT